MGDLTDLSGIGPSTAKRLRQQGIESVDELADADAERLSVPTGNVEKLISRANQQTIQSESMADVLDDYQDKTFVPLGIDPLDDNLGGGLEAETIGLAYGQSGKGKTQVAFSAMVEGASEGTVIYIQTENQSDSIAGRLSSMAESDDVLEHVVRFEAFSLEDQYNSYLNVEEQYDDVALIVVDSFTAQFRVTDQYEGRGDLSERSNEIGNHLRKLGEMARRYSCPVLLTGQVYPTPDAYGQTDRIWGGEKLKHFVSYYLRLSDGQGEMQRVTLQNHPGRDEVDVEFAITDDGLDVIE